MFNSPPPSPPPHLRCEIDYVYTPYVAELFNVLSSLPIFLIGLFGFLWGWRAKYRYRFLIPLAIFGCVGIGSMAFHGTLLFVSTYSSSLETQQLDLSHLPFPTLSPSLSFLSLAGRPSDG